MTTSFSWRTATATCDLALLAERAETPLSASSIAQLWHDPAVSFPWTRENVELY
jgi:hypothetical protein